MNQQLSKQKIDDIHKQVPVDYYEQGIKNNLLQKYWHLRKLITIKEFINNIESKTEKLLDLGCHSGLLTSQIKKNITADVYAVDISEISIKYAQKKYPHINFMVTDIQNGLSYTDSYFDVITTFDVLEHIPNPEQVKDEIKRVLKKDGYLIIGIPNENLLFKVVWFLWTKFNGKVWQDVHVNDFDDEFLNKIYSPQEFKKVAEKKIHLNMWRIVKYKLK